MQTIHSTAHSSRRRDDKARKGTHWDLVRPPAISISTGLGHFMSLTISEVKNDYLVSIQNRDQSTIKSFRFIMSSLR